MSTCCQRVEINRFLSIILFSLFTWIYWTLYRLYTDSIKVHQWLFWINGKVWESIETFVWSKNYGLALTSFFWPSKLITTITLKAKMNSCHYDKANKPTEIIASYRTVFSSVRNLIAYILVFLETISAFADTIPECKSLIAWQKTTTAKTAMFMKTM